MQIIKPQQLVFLNGRYQLGKQPYLGISAVAGFYLSSPEHFACEADIWDSWKKAPMSWRMLDMAEPKPFAEFLLAGHVQTDTKEKVAEARATIGGLSRQWRLLGESDRASLQVTKFSRMALDHIYSYGGEKCIDNPLGRGHQDALSPMLMTVEQGKLQRQSPLAAPCPVPQNFAVRKAYMDMVAAEISDKSWRETIMPGYPESLDLRYFQLAAPAQRLTQSAWPESVPYVLSGFLPAGNVIQGAVPAVQARAFYATHAEPETQIELTLARKTLWLLPDSDLGLIVFTGHVAIEYLMEQPLAYMAIALDDATAPRSNSWYSDVIARRRSDSGSEFASLYDPDLMPSGALMNAIWAKEHNPSSPQYKPGARHDSVQHYEMLQQKIAEQQQRNQSDPPKVEPINWQAFSATCRYPLATLLDNEEKRVIEGEIYVAQTALQAVFRNLTFRQCQFVNCDLTKAQLSGCEFEYCQFEHCTLNGSEFSHSAISKSRFTGCQFDGGQLRECTLTQVGFSETSMCQLQSMATLWQEGQFEQCNLSRAAFIGGEVSRCSFIESQLSASRWRVMTLESCIFNKCDLGNSELEESDIRSGSLLECGCREIAWRRCRLEGTTFRQDCSLAMNEFSECLLVQCGFREVALHNSAFTCTSLSEVSFEGADLRHSRVIRCEMAGCNLQDSLLCYSAWQKSSLQGAVLYHADLSDAVFEGCNLVTAILAMICRNAGSRFDRCLLDEVVWYPLNKVPLKERSDA